jgi:hypothetical protein
VLLTIHLQDESLTEEGQVFEPFQVTGEFPYPREGELIEIDFDVFEPEMVDSFWPPEGLKTYRVFSVDGNDVYCHHNW